jgi:hypothetical protein
LCLGAFEFTAFPVINRSTKDGGRAARVEKLEQDIIAPPQLILSFSQKNHKAANESDFFQRCQIS